MFYPVDSLKKGGRFYLCWIADSWPLRFEQFTHRNKRLWNQDIREICDHLQKVMSEESGRPSRRFSLRLSSQLIRGLARLYQKKVDSFVRDVWTISTQFRSPNTWSVVRTKATKKPRRAREQPQLFVEELPPDEVNLEQLQENAQNIVARVEDITLREPNLPEIQLIEEGFGELNRDPVEMMLAHEVSAMQQSALELPADFSADKSHDRSRLAPHQSAQVERISEHDISVFRKSAVEAPTLTDFEKEIPEIPEIPPPELPAPEPQMQVAQQPVGEMQIEELPRDQPAIEPAKQPEPDEVVLEDLEEEPQRKRQKLRSKLIVDKTTKLSKDYLRVRIANNEVELRCETVKDDIITIKTPAAKLLSRPAHCGPAPTSRLGHALDAMFAEHVANLGRKPVVHRDVEEVMVQRAAHEEPVEQIVVQAEAAADRTIPELEVQDHIIMRDISNIDINARTLQETAMVDISDLPTQKLLTQSQSPNKRTSELERSPKKRPSRQHASLDMTATDANKENIPGAENIIPVQEHAHEIAEIVVPQEERASQRELARVTCLLRGTGLADAPRKPSASDGSETPLGSLDRTKVSLGDSDHTTDSKRFIIEEWGVQGTMNKIFRMVVKKVPRITVERLVQAGPVLESHRRIIAARCFTSILKLKQHGFIEVTKDKTTYEIKHIELGPTITRLR